MRMIAVQSQPRQIVCETLSRKKSITKKGWWSGSRCRPGVQTPALQKKKKGYNCIFDEKLCFNYLVALNTTNILLSRSSN
jgi:hypothetical protein